MNSLWTCRLFKNLSKADITTIMKKNYFIKESFYKNSIIQSQNCINKNLGIILEGKVSVQKTFLNGKLLKLNEIAAGGLFGLANLFSKDTNFPTVITASTKCTILFISEANLLKLLEDNSTILYNYLSFCSSRVLYLNDKIELFNLPSAKEKVMYFLIKENELQGNNNIIKLSYSKESLCDYLSISHTSLYREFKILQDKKLINIVNRTITINDLKGLHNLIKIG